MIDGADFFVPKREPSKSCPSTEDRSADEEYFRRNLFRAIKLPEHHKMDSDQIGIYIKKTFDEMGIPGFRPLRSALLVRTLPMPEKTGSIYLPPKLATFYGELPHMQPITARVLAAGPKASVKPGDLIAFMRLYFSRWETLEDHTHVGWLVDEVNIMGWVDLEGDKVADLRVDSGRR